MSILQFFSRLSNILGIKRPQPKPAEAPTHFQNPEKFNSAILLHSRLLSCFAHAQYIISSSNSTADIIIHATAWLPESPEERVFTMAYTLCESANWPLLPGMQDRVAALVDHLNALSCPVQMPAQE